FAYGNYTFPRKGMEFFPKGEPEEVVVSMAAPTGTTLAVSDDYVQEVEGYVEDYQPSLNAVVANVGRSRGFGGTATHKSHVVLAFPDWEHWVTLPTQVVTELRKKLEGMVGVEVKLGEQQMGPPTGAPLNIEVRGEDYPTMLQTVEAIKRRIKNIPGLVDLTDDFDRSRPEVKVMINRDKAARLGLRAREIAGTVRTAFNGKKVSVFRDGQDEYDIVVQLDQSFRKTATDLSSLYIHTPSGDLVRLSEIAEVRTGPSYGSIRHVETNRVITVSGDAFKVPGPVLVKLAQKKLVGLELPSGITYSFTGEDKEQREMQAFIGQSMVVAVFLIFVVMVAQFNSIVLPLIVLTSVFMSIMGVLLGLIVHDRPFGIIMTGIGTVALAGIVVNNAIV
ncbi:MAG: efflux RND transporter permease subunit, partial [SAR324 cluster bacterium]|nr:efflux RND transporter permease subunit [SAR324 cluster bacterium]